MRKHLEGILAAVALLAVLVFALGAGTFFGGSGSGSSSSLDTRLDRAGDVHSWSDREALERQHMQPIGTLCPLFHDGDSSVVTMAAALFDSIRLGLGDWGDSSFAGADLRFTVFVMPTLVIRSGNSVRATVEQLATLDPVRYEIGTHGPSSERLGPLGMDGSGQGGGRVTFNGDTGMDVGFFRAVVGSYQDSLATWGLPAATSHAPANWRMSLGAGPEWLELGYYQQATLTVLAADDSSASPNGVIGAQRNDDEWPRALFNRTGSPWKGLHRFGEPANRYDIGTRGSWSNTGADSDGPDSLKVYTDIVTHTASVGFPVFHTIRETTGNAHDISYAHFRELAIYWAYRVDAGVLQLRTFEQGVDCIMSVPRGNLMPNYGFRVLADDSTGGGTAQLSPAMPGLLTPYGHPVPLGNDQLYWAANDTIRAPGGTANRIKLSGAIAGGDTVRDAYIARFGDTNELSYALADPGTNVLVQRTLTTGTQSTYTIIPKVSRIESRYVVVTVQCVWVEQDNNVEEADLAMFYKAGPFSERWEDNVNYGKSSYQVMQEIMGGAASDGGYNHLYDRSRVFPQFNLWGADSTVTRADNSSVQMSALVPAVGGPQTLYAAVKGSTTGHGYDIVSAFGNRYSYTAAGDALQSHSVNAEMPGEIAQPTDHYFYVRVDEHSDLIWAAMGFEVHGTNMVSNGHLVILHTTVQPL